MQRSSSYLSPSPTSSIASSRTGSSATTIGLGTISGRAILALGETVINGARRLTRHGRHDRSVVSLASTVPSQWSDLSRRGFSLAESYQSRGSWGSGSTVPGPGQLSGKAIKALGKLSLRGLDEIQLRYRLGRLRLFFPHGRRVFWEPDDGEEMYEEILDFTRPGLYSSRIRKAALGLLISQIGFREVDQLIKALYMWDAESVLQLLYNFVEIVLGPDTLLKKSYLRFQDAPTLDPLLPLATFLLQLSFVNIPALQAAQAAGAFLSDRLPICNEPLLAYHLLQVLVTRNPFEDKNYLQRSMISCPASAERWKFSWLLSCVAFGGGHWDTLIAALVNSREHIRNTLILRLLSCVLDIWPSESASYFTTFGKNVSTVIDGGPSGSHKEHLDEHLLSGFLLACSQGAKSTAWVAGKDPLESMLGFLLHALRKAPCLCTAFASADDFLLEVQPFLHSNLVPAEEVLQKVMKGITNPFLADGTPKPEAERMRLCFSIYQFLTEERKNWT